VGTKSSQLRRRTATGNVARLALLGAMAAGALYAARDRRRIAFTGRTVLITGGSRGLGLELARLFAAEGANLVLIARDAEKLSQAARELESHGTRTFTYPCDITDSVQVRQAVAASLNRSAISMFSSITLASFKSVLWKT
jgi:FlaA1/EpsC-like NDP-sugar epimerase